MTALDFLSTASSPAFPSPRAAGFKFGTGTAATKPAATTVSGFKFGGAATTTATAPTGKEGQIGLSRGEAL